MGEWLWALILNKRLMKKIVICFQGNVSNNSRIKCDFVLALRILRQNLDRWCTVLKTHQCIHRTPYLFLPETRLRRRKRYTYRELCTCVRYLLSWRRALMLVSQFSRDACLRRSVVLYRTIKTLVYILRTLNFRQLSAMFENKIVQKS